MVQFVLEIINICIPGLWQLLKVLSSENIFSPKRQSDELLLIKDNGKNPSILEHELLSISFHFSSEVIKYLFSYLVQRQQVAYLHENYSTNNPSSFNDRNVEFFLSRFLRILVEVELW